MEEKIFQCENHWLLMSEMLLCAVLFLLMGAYLAAHGMSGILPVFILAAVLCVGMAYLKMRAQSLYMTKTAIVGQKGIVNTTKVASPLSKIQDVSCESTLINKIFRCQTVIITTAGTAGVEYRFNWIKNGHEFQMKFLSLTNSNNNSGEKESE